MVALANDDDGSPRLIGRLLSGTECGGACQP